MSDDSINNLRKEIMDKIDNLTKSMSEMQVTLAGLPEKIFEKADERYASRRRVGMLEKIVYGVIGAILMVVVYMILAKTFNIQMQIG